MGGGVEGLHEERVADLLVACVACGGLPKGRLSPTGRGWLLPEGLSSPLAVTSTHNGGAEAEAEAAGAAGKQDQRHLYRVGRACQEGRGCWGGGGGGKQGRGLKIERKGMFGLVTEKKKRRQ